MIHVGDATAFDRSVVEIQLMLMDGVDATAFDG